MQKNSQVTLFIIIGLVVFLVSAFIIYMGFSNLKTASEAQNAESASLLFADDAIKSFAESCIRIVSVEAGYEIGIHGGYAQPPQDYFRTYIEGAEYNITMVLQQGQNRLLSANEIEQQIGDYIKNNLPKCVNNFEDFTTKGYQIGQEPASSIVKIKDDGYEVQVTYPLTIKIGNEEKKISDFSPIYVPIRIKKVLQIANEIVSKSIANPSNIDIRYLLDLQKDNMIALYFPKPEERRLVFFLHDPKSSVLKGSLIFGQNDQNPESNRQYLFIFGLDFSWYQSPAQNDFDIIKKIVDER